MSFWNKAGEVLLTGAGVATLVAGIRQYRQRVPKPTKSDKITRIDYLSGQYEESLRSRDQKIRRNHQIGTLCISLGSALLAGGIYLLTTTISSEFLEESSGPSDTPVPAEEPA